jgi:hypothetical protein
MKRKRQRQSKGPYVAIPKAIWETAAWRAMSPWARLLWIDMRGWLRNDDLNNGKVHRSCRKAAETLGGNKDTIARCFAELEHYGFVRVTQHGFLGADGHGLATQYRFTDLAYGAHPATLDFTKWDGELFVYRPRKKQKPVCAAHTPCIVPKDIQKPVYGAAVCIVPSDIHVPSPCIVRSDTSRLPVGKGEEIQGSSTERAPALNGGGGAGSSPAPVANIVEHVASVVAGELDKLCRQLNRPHADRARSRPSGRIPPTARHQRH